MRLPPADLLGTWPTPNYIDPVTRGDGALIVNVVCVAVAFTVVCLRMYTRLRITYSTGADDFLILIAMGLTIAMCTVTSLATIRYGWTRHIWDVPPQWLPGAQKLNMAFQILFSLASAFTKISLLWFCRRLLGAGIKGGYQLLNIGLIGGIVFVALLSVIFTFVTIFQCTPIHAYWDTMATYYPHKCLDDGAIVFAASVVNIFTDLMVTVFPMPLIWNLNLPKRQRMAVISIFGLGVIVNVAGTVRTVYVYKSMIASYDETWMGWPVLIAAAVEINLGLICASAPALRPLIAFFLPRLLQSTRNRSYYSNQKALSRRWTASRPSKHSQMLSASESRLRNPHEDPAFDRFQILRTVEMDTWSESRRPGLSIGLAYNISSQSSGTTALKAGSFVHVSQASAPSSASSSRHSRDGGSPFTDKHSV